MNYRTPLIWHGGVLKFGLGRDVPPRNLKVDPYKYKFSRKGDPFIMSIGPEASNTLDMIDFRITIINDLPNNIHREKFNSNIYEALYIKQNTTRPNFIFPYRIFFSNHSHSSSLVPDPLFAVRFHKHL